jgi:hypothetical protein
MKTFDQLNEDQDVIKIILPAKCIPISSIVSKKNGTKLYIIRHLIRIFNDKGLENEIKCDEETRFLISINPVMNDGSVNVINGNTELVWYAEARDVISYLENKYYS